MRREQQAREQENQKSMCSGSQGKSDSRQSECHHDEDGWVK